jgi:hypothetical protein
MARMGEKGSAYGILIKTSEEKGQLARSRSRWDNDVKIYFTETG